MYSIYVLKGFIFFFKIELNQQSGPCINMCSVIKSNPKVFNERDVCMKKLTI